MVGIYKKIKDGLNWIKGKALKYVAPVVGQIGDFAQSDFIQGLAGVAAPALDMAVPGLGMGINKGLNWVGKVGDIANGLASDYEEQGDNLEYADIFKNVASGKYTKKNRVPKGIDLSHRPEELHPRIEIKALPSPEDQPGAFKSYVEELD